MNARSLFAAAAVAASTALSAGAQEELDFYIARSETDTSGIVFGTISDEFPDVFFFPGERAVTVEFGPNFGGGFLAEEPGFFNPGTAPDGGGNVFEQAPGAVAPNENDAVNVTFINVELGDLADSPLFFWDGTGEVEFTAVPDLFNTFDVAQIEDLVDDTGFIDDHPTVTFTDPSDPGDNPPEGIYLTSLTAQIISSDGLSDTVNTPPLFVVLGSPTASEASLDAALSFVNTALVPEPASATMLLLAAAGLVRRRQK